MLKRTPITYTETRGYHVALPTYQIIGGTFLPIKKGVLHKDGPYPNAEPADVMALKPTVIVMAPLEDCLTEVGQVCPVKISTKYQGHPIYDSADYQPPALMEFHPIELQPPKDSTVFERIAHRMGIGKK